MSARTDPAFFEAMYQDAPDHDPWRFADDEYEQARYRTLDGMLGLRLYQRAFEPGCAIGAFTRLLARRCDAVDAIDVSRTAVGEARQRNADLGHVQHAVGTFPQWPIAAGHRYDLICLVEIGYYFDAPTLERITREVVDQLLVPSGDVLVSHWTGHSDDHVLGGLEVQRRIARVLDRCGLEPASGRRTRPRFVVERWHRPDDDLPAGDDEDG